jgi:LmbE family N-acetylglucosaminyl deacetylase
MMLRLGASGGQPVRRVLAIGAHSDDLEIGCGGTLLALCRAEPGVSVHWLVLAAPGERGDEARESASALLAGVEGQTVEIHSLRDGYLPHAAAEVKDVFEELKARVDPELVLTHTRDDLHQDHRLACELTWNTFRDHLILEYEIPKWDGDVGRPNVYVPLSDELVHEKLEILSAHFGSQSGKHWFDTDLFRGLMRIRGMECRAPSGFAEAFFVRKLTLEL